MVNGYFIYWSMLIQIISFYIVSSQWKTKTKKKNLLIRSLTIENLYMDLEHGSLVDWDLNFKSIFKSMFKGSYLARLLDHGKSRQNNKVTLWHTREIITTLKLALLLVLDLSNHKYNRTSSAIMLFISYFSSWLISRHQ